MFSLLDQWGLKIIFKTQPRTDFYSYLIIFISAATQTDNRRLGDRHHTIGAIAQHAPVSLLLEKRLLLRLQCIQHVTESPLKSKITACVEPPPPPKIQNRAIFLSFFTPLLPRLPSRSDAHAVWRGGLRPGEGRIKARLPPSRVARRTKHQEQRSSLANFEVVQREFWGEVTVGVLPLYCSAE